LCWISPSFSNRSGLACRVGMVPRACVWTVIVETALYFPHIRVPETSWFAQILLYWDRAAAIVPYSLSTDESSVGRYMTQLA
jgi:hypothetical protein